MRMEGSLSEWNDEKGFGFIAPREGGPEVFVPLSAFPRDGRRPTPGERVWFEIELDPQGRKRAVRLARSGEALDRPARRWVPLAAPQARGGLGRVVLLLVAAGAVFLAFSLIREEAGTALEVSPVQRAPATATAGFRCDGRIRCAEMTSCEEARYFLRHCPGVDMASDGEACERHWCAGPSAR